MKRYNTPHRSRVQAPLYRCGYGIFQSRSHGDVPQGKPDAEIAGLEQEISDVDMAESGFSGLIRLQRYFHNLGADGI